MKKIIILCCIAVNFFLLASCNHNFEENDNANYVSNGNSEVAVKIQELKNSGLLDEVLLSSSRNATDETSAAIIEFVNNTDKVLNKIQKTDNGNAKVAVINALFTGANIYDFADCFSQINNEKAEEFENYMNTNFVSDENVSNRSIYANDTIKLSFNSDMPNNRGAYASDLEWSTIAWYSGFCASTIAGFYLLSYGGFWLKIAGAVAASAGTASMVTQLVKWYNCSDLGAFISSLIGQNSAASTKIANSETGKKLLTIVAETAATIVACYISPAGRAIVKTIVHYYNLLIEKVLSVLPSGITYIINGIQIKKI